MDQGRPLTKKEALGLLAMPVILAGIGVGAGCVTVYFLCAIAAGQVGRWPAAEFLRVSAGRWGVRIGKRQVENLATAPPWPRGWPIATGVIEGASRYLVKDRMDITGAR